MCINASTPAWVRVRHWSAPERVKPEDGIQQQNVAWEFPLTLDQKLQTLSVSNLELNSQEKILKKAEDLSQFSVKMTQSWSKTSWSKTQKCIQESQDLLENRKAVPEQDLFIDNSKMINVPGDDCKEVKNDDHSEFVEMERTSSENSSTVEEEKLTKLSDTSFCYKMRKKDLSDGECEKGSWSGNKSVVDHLGRRFRKTSGRSESSDEKEKNELIQSSYEVDSDDESSLARNRYMGHLEPNDTLESSDSRRQSQTWKRDSRDLCLQTKKKKKKQQLSRTCLQGSRTLTSSFLRFFVSTLFMLSLVTSAVDAKSELKKKTKRKFN